MIIAQGAQLVRKERLIFCIFQLPVAGNNVIEGLLGFLEFQQAGKGLVKLPSVHAADPQTEVYLLIIWKVFDALGQDLD